MLKIILLYIFISIIWDWRGEGEGSAPPLIFLVLFVYLVFIIFNYNNWYFSYILGMKTLVNHVVFVVCCHRYGFGSEGKPEYKIGPDKDIIYEVTLNDFQRVSPAFFSYKLPAWLPVLIWFVCHRATTIFTQFLCYLRFPQG